MAPRCADLGSGSSAKNPLKGLEHQLPVASLRTSVGEWGASSQVPERIALERSHYAQAQILAFTIKSKSGNTVFKIPGRSLPAKTTS